MVVSGRQVARVVFALDGRVVRSLSRPNSATRYKLLVNPRRLRLGRHRVLARVSFDSQSATRPKTLRVAFGRCAGGASPAAAAG